MTDPKIFYEQQAEHYSTESRRSGKILLGLSFFRLLAFLLFVGFSYYWWIERKSAFGIPAGVALLLFLALVRFSIYRRKKKDLQEKLVFLLKNELSVLGGAPNQLDAGSSFISSDGIASDLDIFGPGSLFQLINRCSSSHGRDKLARQLTETSTDPGTIRLRQQAIRTMAAQPVRRQWITARGLLQGEKEGNLRDLVSWLRLPPVINGKKGMVLVRWLVPGLNLALLAYGLLSVQFFPFLCGVALSWIITGAWGKKINQQHAYLGRKQAILDQYAAILEEFEQLDIGESDWLKQLSQSTKNALFAIRHLSRLTALFDQRINMLVPVIFNSLFLYDIQCQLELDAWRTRYQDDWRRWMEAIGEIESLNSFAAFAFNNPDFPDPEIDTEQLILTASGLGHPLIPRKECVLNDIRLGTDYRILLITGSNMSGKTTFLRTVGVNLILAQNGAPVFAQHFRWSPVQVLSAIRVTDSLQEHTSYFMAELRRLRQIVQILETGKPALILIDEILRGTNTDDKTHGSEMFIRKILGYHCLSLFATHNLMLSRLETDCPGEVGNACFESEIQDHQLLFDYKLRPGIARNRNASFLMKEMNII